MTDKRELGGIIPALVTPFSSDGDVDHGVLAAIVEKVIDDGASGVYVTGSTGEAFLLSEDERMEVLEGVCGTVSNRIAVIAHVGSISTRQSVRLAQHAEKLGVDAVSAVAPFYYKFSFEEIVGHYDAILGSCEVPLVIYNFPAFSGTTLDPSWARGLLLNPRVIAVKHTSMDLYGLERLRHVRPGLKVLSGYDEVFLGALAMGAEGAVGSTFNVLTPWFVELTRRFQTGDTAGARELQEHINDLIDTLLTVGVLNGIKYILRLNGIEAGVAREPFKGLTQDDQVRLARDWARFTEKTSAL